MASYYSPVYWLIIIIAGADLGGLFYCSKILKSPPFCPVNNEKWVWLFKWTIGSGRVFPKRTPGPFENSRSATVLPYYIDCNVIILQYRSAWIITLTRTCDHISGVSLVTGTCRWSHQEPLCLCYCSACWSCLTPASIEGSIEGSFTLTCILFIHFQICHAHWFTSSMTRKMSHMWPLTSKNSLHLTKCLKVGGQVLFIWPKWGQSCYHQPLAPLLPASLVPAYMSSPLVLG
jgi:hypothetical protein